MGKPDRENDDNPQDAFDYADAFPLPPESIHRLAEMVFSKVSDIANNNRVSFAEILASLKEPHVYRLKPWFRDISDLRARILTQATHMDVRSILHHSERTIEEVSSELQKMYQAHLNTPPATPKNNNLR